MKQAPRTTNGRATVAYVTNVVLALVPPGTDARVVLEELERRVRRTEEEAVDAAIDAHGQAHEWECRAIGR